MRSSSPEYRIAAALELIAAETGEQRWRRAASELRRPPAAKRGPKTFDDSAALAEMHLLINGGLAVETAARHVATTVAGNSMSSKTKRLARKYRGELISGAEIRSATKPTSAL
jgi:hypothetical protein